MTEAEHLYQKREKRINDAISLTVPDRVPILLFLNHYLARYAGMILKDAYYDLEKWLNAASE